jgi:aminoglycoside phosphotransferase
MPEQARSTHEIAVVGAHVEKRFRAGEQAKARREWAALTLLAEFAPGLAALPVSADTEAPRPYVRMTRLPGEPWSGRSPTARRLDGLAVGLDRLHFCLPPEVLAEVRPQRWVAEGMANRMRALTAGSPPPYDDAPETRSAFAAARRWLDRTDGPGGQAVPVFGRGDANLDDFLWDGERIRTVDFEESGRSDRAFELAALVEHVSVWHDAGVEAAQLLDRFDLDTEQSARVLFFRRTFAVHWLYVVHRRPDHAGVPPRQAERLLTLLA